MVRGVKQQDLHDVTNFCIAVVQIFLLLIVKSTKELIDILI